MHALLTEGTLKPHPFLDKCSESFLNQLEEFAVEVEFSSGETIFNEGGYADRFYLILSGKVALQCDRDAANPLTIQVIGPGELLGWSWLFQPFEYHFTARTLENCTALVLNGAALLIRAEENPAFGYELMKRVSRQVVQRLQSTRNLLVALS